MTEEQQLIGYRKTNLYSKGHYMYSLMGADLHGINGLNPLITWKLWRTFVVPRMLYEIETLKITTTDIYKLEQFQKKTLKQLLGLPQQTADPAIYILLAAECIEQIIHKAIIGCFYGYWKI